MVGMIGLSQKETGFWREPNRNDDIPKEPIEWVSLIDVFVEVVVRICRLQRAALSIALDRTLLFVGELESWTAEVRALGF